MTGFFLIIGFFIVAYIIDLITGGKHQNNKNLTKACVKDVTAECITHDQISLDMRKNIFQDRNGGNQF
jgi:hypothetical protein